MKIIPTFIFACLFFLPTLKAQELVASANHFIGLLNEQQKIKALFPETITIWGGYFAANQFKVSLESNAVDYIINGPGDVAFPSLISALEKELNELKGIFIRNRGEIYKLLMDRP